VKGLFARWTGFGKLQRRTRQTQPKTMLEEDSIAVTPAIPEEIKT
jgi:hypothetical protein